MNLANCDPHGHSNGRQHGFLATRPDLYEQLWSRQGISEESGMILRLAHRVELEVQCDGDK